MDKIKNLLHEISVTNFEIGSTCWVDITHVSLNNLYVRPTAYNEYLPILQARGESLDEYDAEINEIVIYKSKAQKSYVRGKILSKVGADHNLTFKLYAMDFGCTEDKVPLRRLYKPLYETSVPALATICRLADSGPPTSYDSFMASLWKYDKGEQTRMLIKNKTPDALVVEIYNTNQINIATMLEATGFSPYGYVLCLF